MNITYRYFDSPAQEQEVKRVLEANLPLLPFWCHDIYVDRCGTDGATIAEVECVPEYRRLNIRVYHPFFDRPEEIRHRDMCHEICHGLWANVSNWVRGIVLESLKTYNKEMAEAFEKEFIVKLEGVNQDMAFTLSKLTWTP
jgi:hypothetical protein